MRRIALLTVTMTIIDYMPHAVLVTFFKLEIKAKQVVCNIASYVAIQFIAINA